MATKWQKSKARTLRSYRRGRMALIKLMGGRCAECGYRWRLQFHHLYFRSWVARKKNRWVRLANYRRDYALGLIVLCCANCNRQAGKPEEE